MGYEYVGWSLKFKDFVKLIIFEATIIFIVLRENYYESEYVYQLQSNMISLFEMNHFVTKILSKSA